MSLGGFWMSCCIIARVLQAMVKAAGTWERDILNELLHLGIENLNADIVLLGGHDECDLKLM